MPPGILSFFNQNYFTIRLSTNNVESMIINDQE